MTVTDKIRSAAQVDSWIQTERGAGRKIGFTCGAFDVMHAGHADYLALAKARCDRLLVAVNSDESIRRYKNPLRPLNPWNERAFVVAALEATDCVTVLEEDRPLALIQRWKPDVYIKGGDYAPSALRSSSAVAAYGGESIVIASAFPAASTTALFERIQALALHEAPLVAHPSHATGLVLIDRDGTLVKDASFDPGQVELLRGVAESLKRLQDAGYLLCIVSNQQGIGLGYFGYRDFIDGNRKLLRLLGKEGIAIRKIYFCPHSLGEPCDCRKPAPGLILKALRDLNAAPENAFVIGDSIEDMEAASAAGCSGLYVGPDHPRYTAITFSEAAETILKAPKTRS
ncbi:MAG TPA: HAD-IIIA family hydrolase [Bryobacteraceae bacterium]|jgi:rfaE bifunctional protein nucleotidyltransferase chain/domain|nr:HAD-IIIA family hydrolase [Bryobacteraceae bacterium]